MANYGSTETPIAKVLLLWIGGLHDSIKVGVTRFDSV